MKLKKKTRKKTVCDFRYTWYYLLKAQINIAPESKGKVIRELFLSPPIDGKQNMAA